MRNVSKAIERGREIVRKHPRKDLTFDECLQLAISYKHRIEEGQDRGDSLMTLIEEAFLVGLTVNPKSERRAKA